MSPSLHPRWSRPAHGLSVLLCVLSAGVLLSALPCPARAGVVDRVELVLGHLEADVEGAAGSDFSGLTWGLRGAWEFRPNWSLRGGLMHHSQSAMAPSDPVRRPWLARVEQLHLDLSVERRWSLGANSLGLSGGAGLREIERRVATDGEEFESATTTELSLNLGVAGTVPLGERAYFRPELKARHSESATDFEGTIAFGWRLGSGTAR